MSDTFGDVWRRVKLHCPLAGPQLCQEWVRQVYQRACDRRPWSWLRVESEFLINPARTGQVSVVRGSRTVTGLTLVLVETDVDRQFRAGVGSPVYTITAVNALMNTATLDRVYGSDTQPQCTATVMDAYVTLPEDFGRFLAVLDPHNGWQLRWWVTEEELNHWDAQRSASGTPWALVSRRLGTTAATVGRAQYELWPYPTAQANYPYYYIRRPHYLQDDDPFEGVLAQRGDIIKDGALAEAASWPGLEGRKNAYFNLALAKAKKIEFHDELSLLEVRDEEVYNTWWETVGWTDWPHAPIDANFMQKHAFAFPF